MRGANFTGDAGTSGRRGLPVGDTTGMLSVHSTADIHPRDRLSYWVEVATKGFYTHEFRSRVGPSFHAELRSGLVDRIWAGICKCEPCDIGRVPHDIARDDVDDILLSVRLSGETVIAQDGQEAAHGAGTMALLDSRRPSSIHFLSPTETVVIMIPRQQLVARLGDPGALVVRPIRVDGPIAGLAAGFLSMLVERAGGLDGLPALKLSEQALDLVALAFANEAQLKSVTLSSPRATALARLKAAIEASLHDPGLKPAGAAAAAGISVRYANALLAREDSSLERYIMHRRLERCRQALENPAQAHRMIGEIAFSWGFADLSHFGRRFRAAYGATPGDWRQRARTQGDEPSVCSA